ncbi:MULTISPECIES: 3'-5' exonuclease [Halomonas]|uniref:3'-5' exonuclease n=1 Tax=Halomonas halophila TaxID=29573 RepID=A0ABQ0U2L8_9GAMM|nr:MULTISPECIES: 3'-5' exonuclease [Halomonas]MDR5890153.1 3'-5' exonuclease [Halomonas salina]PSJ23229.1 3'-5' exonuclease [Halomonas sp. ND22Bw]WJY06587.1 3'-5' exonuclease [Halomonas halophila]GEK72774.1 3'-5' exonuclease [Halomonas halophila]
MLMRRRTQIPDWTSYLAHRAAAAQDPRLSRFFTAGAPAPETPIGEAPLVALDMETTGLDARRNSIVSIGLVPFTLGRIAVTERRYWIVRPRRTLNAESVTFHHITHADIANAPELGDILEDLLDALAGRLAVVHYRHIERPFLDVAVKARLGEGVVYPMIDTMSLEARIHRQSLVARFKRWIGRPPASIRLFDSRARYGLPPYQGHHALTDALATAELLQAQIAHHYSPETPVGTIWS